MAGSISGSWEPEPSLGFAKLLFTNCSSSTWVVSNCDGFGGCRFLQGKDIGLETDDERVCLVCHVDRGFVDSVASGGDGNKLGGVVEP